MSNRRLRIAFDNSLSGRSLAGTGRYASHLIRELSLSPDVDLTVFDGPRIARDSETFAGRVARNMANQYWMRSQFPRILRTSGFDVHHGPAFFIPRRSSSAGIVTVHDLTFRLFPSHIRSGWGDYVASQMPSILENASGIICISEQTKHDLLKFYQIPGNKIHVVYNGIDHSRFHPDVRLSEEWAHNLGLRDGYVLHVGSLVLRKNIPALLRAISLLRARGKWGERQLLLTGTEIRSFPGASEIYQTIQKLNLADVVVLAGHVPDDQIPGLYAHASMLVMPTLYEGFGLPILESMAVGTPVVASNNSSIPEVAGDAAILVPTGDKQALADSMEKVLQDPAVARQLRERGFVQAAKFSWQRMAAETVEVYRNVTK